MELLIAGMLGLGAGIVVAKLGANDKTIVRRINNTQAHHLASRNYTLIQTNVNGRRTTLMFTDHEMEVASTRANANPEDVWRHR